MVFKYVYQRFLTNWEKLNYLVLIPRKIIVLMLVLKWNLKIKKRKC